MNETQWVNLLSDITGNDLYDFDGDTNTYILNQGENSVKVKCINTREYALTLRKEYEIVELQVTKDYNEETDCEFISSLYVKVINDKGILTKYNILLFDMQESILKCHYCDCELDRWNLINVKIGKENKNVCNRCYEIEGFHRCKRCGVKSTETDYLPTKKGEEQHYCHKCFKEESKEGVMKCSVCSRISFVRRLTKNKGQCESCWNHKHEIAERIFPLTTPNPLRLKSNTKYRTIGVELEVNAKDNIITDTQKLRKELDKHKFKGKKLSQLVFAKRDGSLDGDLGVEFNTSVLTNNEEGLNALRIIIDIMNKHFETNEKCGLHVHFGMNDVVEEDLKNLYYFYLKFEDNLKYYVPKDRITNHYCRKMTYIPPTRLKGITDMKNHIRDRYKAVNFNALNKYGTLEIRLMDGNLNSDRIIEWIKLHSRIISYVKEHKDLLNKYIRLNDSKIKQIIGRNLFEDFCNRKSYYDKQEEFAEKMSPKLFRDRMTNLIYPSDEERALEEALSLNIAFGNNEG